MSPHLSKKRLVNQTLTMPYLKVIHARNSIWDRAYRRCLVPHERTHHPLFQGHAAGGKAAVWEIWGNRECIVTICVIQIISYAPYSTIKAHSEWCDGVGSSHSTFFRWQRRKQTERSFTIALTVVSIFWWFRKDTTGDDPSWLETRLPAVWIIGNFPVNGCTGRRKILWGSVVSLRVKIPVSFKNELVSSRLGQLCIPTVEEIVISLVFGVQLRGYEMVCHERPTRRDSDWGVNIVVVDVTISVPQFCW
jgi:hypothetical protein